MAAQIAGFEVEAFARRLRTRRLELGLSQRDLHTAGITSAYISRLENATRVPSVSAAIALADRLDTTAEWLLFGRRQHPCPFCKR